MSTGVTGAGAGAKTGGGGVPISGTIDVPPAVPDASKPGDNERDSAPASAREGVVAKRARAEARKGAAAHASNVSSPHTTDLLDSFSTYIERIKSLKDAGAEALVGYARGFARSVQKKVAKAGGVVAVQRQPNCESAPADKGRTTSPPTERLSTPGRLSVSHSLDGYRPDHDVTAPISVRTIGMELLWVCGDCGEHYARAQQCPERCVACAAPKEHFYAPIED